MLLHGHRYDAWSACNKPRGFCEALSRGAGQNQLRTCLEREKRAALRGARRDIPVEGDTIHLIPTMALNTNSIGVDFAVKVIRLNKRTLVSQGEYPPSNPTTTRELNFRRL